MFINFVASIQIFDQLLDVRSSFEFSFHHFRFDQTGGETQQPGDLHETDQDGCLIPVYLPLYVNKKIRKYRDTSSFYWRKWKRLSEQN